MAKNRRQLSADARLRVFMRDKFRCVYCGTSGTDAELHVDHRVPVASGGSNHISNLATACAPCNRKKGTGPEPRPDGAVFAKGDALAVGMRGGMCPVGMVVSVSDAFISMQLFDWLIGSFCGATITVAVSEIVQVMYAEKMTHEDARSKGYIVDPAEVWFDMVPLGTFQTRWKEDHKAAM